LQQLINKIIGQPPDDHIYLLYESSC